MEGINNMGEQVGNVSREMKAKINQKEILAIKKNTVTEKKNASDGLISRLDMAE